MTKLETNKLTEKIQNPITTIEYLLELRAIMDALAESVIDSTDEEILEEVREEGLQPEAIAKQVHETLLSSVKKYKNSISLI